MSLSQRERDIDAAVYEELCTFPWDGLRCVPHALSMPDRARRIREAFAAIQWLRIWAAMEDARNAAATLSNIGHAKRKAKTDNATRQLIAETGWKRGPSRWRGV